MAQRNLEGDILVNLLSIHQAKEKKFFGFLGEPRNGATRDAQDEDRSRDKPLGGEEVGIGAKIPENLQDDVFAQDDFFSQPLTASSEKLLQQLLGKKAAKGHIAAKQAPQNVKTSRNGKPVKPTKQEVSEDEEEGRAAAFGSKRRKIAKSAEPSEAPDPPDSREHSLMMEENVDPASAEAELDSTRAVRSEKQVTKKDGVDGEDPITSGTKSKPATYLDEILAERSRKKKKKKLKNKEGSQP
ncbi:uncharacterized protein EI97DRAFT_110975 [Westerdykella ornata]|uniref:Uncharacterized protein n=1 Tax=Westerdykella ornata TaxID=318751 RepID=A0A6A6JU23_WESOR|nr:uncharacterized protein EI97DRAFT_110975 [Westerdykella ornata]KAF2280101.1 hypothetical protein EI97DRAFT_110975 [Westerdykella ornata]